MQRYLVFALMFFGGSVSAQAQCGVMPWSIPYLGSNTTTSMVVSSGEACPIYTSVGGTNIITSVNVTAPAGNDTASAGDDTVTYQSQPGYTGPDSFTFSVTGSGPGGSGTSAVQVSVTVQ